jgi:hypothetical protein
MKSIHTISIHRLSLQFDGDQITHGRPEEQAAQAIALINQVLQREPFGLAAQLIATRDEIEVETSTCEACDGLGWLKCNVGNDQLPRFKIQRCDACEAYETDEAAQEAAARGDAGL